MDRTYGRHLRAWRGSYWHHAIDVGSGWVIHFTGLTKDKGSATIRLEAFDVFWKRDKVEIVPYALAFHPDEVVRRARSRLGQSGYDAFQNNCEHFARWCMTGEHRSGQVEKIGATAAGAAGSTVLGTAATTGVMAIGEAAGVRGAAALMKGLKMAGRPVGAGVAGGVVVMAVAPAVAANVAIGRALPDDPMLPDAERGARGAGRKTTAFASALGAAGSVGLISVAGVPGLSAVGITTGLAEIGAFFGGGLVAGAVAVVAIPALLALGLGLFVYHRAIENRSDPASDRGHLM
jgi:hypothetical protein